MFHLLNLEWKKQKDFILFRVLVIVFAVALPSLLFIGKNFKVQEGMPFDPQIMLFHFPTVWEWLAYIGNWLGHLIFGFMAVLLVTNEHSYRTLRQNVITGMQRSDWFWSKAQFILTTALLATAYYALCAIVIGLMHADTIYLATVFKGAGEMAMRFFLMILGFMSFGMFIGVLVKRTGIAIFLYLAYTMMGESILRGLHMHFFRHKSWNWYPWNTFEDLCHVPSAEIANEFLEEEGVEFFLNPTMAMTLATAYILLFGWLSYRRLQRSDL